MNETRVATTPRKHSAPTQGGNCPILLQAADLHKTYKLGQVEVPVLKGASLDIHKGEWIAILGASGSGKSTLMHLLGDLDHADPGKGDILFDGVSLQSMSGHQRNLYRNKSVGFVFQFYHLLPELNVLENTMLAGMVGRQPWYWYILLAAGIIPGLIYEEFKYRIERARLHDRAASLLESFGLQHRLTHRPRELSGGERQRVAIARALMNEPKILLADEPTGNLDETTGGEILDLIAAQHKKGLTIVMVTHDQAIADRADRVVQLHDGRVQ